MLSRRHDTLFVAANLFPIRGDSVVARPILLARIPGAPLDAPQGDFQFVHPKIVAAPNGDLHLLWAEFAGTVERVAEWPSATQTTLWHSVHRNRRWSEPRVALRSHTLRWTRDDGQLAIDGAGALHAVIWSFDSAFTGIVHLRLDGHEWRARRVAPGTLQQATAIDAHGDSITVAYFGNSADTADRGGLTLIHSADRGGSWSSPRVVLPLHGRVPSHPRFVRHRDGARLVWAESRQRQVSIDTLRVTRLEDGGVKTPAALALPPEAAWFSLAAAPCGEMSVLVGTFSMRPLTFEVSIGSRGEVSRTPFVGEGRLAAFAGAGATLRAFTALVATQPRPGSPVQVMVTSRPACSESQPSTSR